MNPTRIAVLGSTNGTDLTAVINSISRGELNGLAEIAVVISDNQNSGILNKATHYNLDNVFINPLREDGKRRKREDYDKDISTIIERYKVDLLINIGWMRLYSNNFVEKYFGRNMNIHPSLLPSFKGMDLDVHQAVLDYGCKVSGCTLFFIDKGKDDGPIILQKAVPVIEDDTKYSLKERVQKAEQDILVKGIELFAKDKLYLKGRKVYINYN